MCLILLKTFEAGLAIFYNKIIQEIFNNVQMMIGNNRDRGEIEPCRM